MNNGKCMIWEYEVKQTFDVCGTTIVYAENMQAEDKFFYMVADFTGTELFGRYNNIVVTDSYTEAIEEFGIHILSQLEKIKTNRERSFWNGK